MNGRRVVKVLVIDDERNVLKVAAAQLAKGAYPVVPVSDAAEGLAASKDPSVDVAVVDLSWSNGGGLDLVRSIHKARPEVEIVVLQSQGLEEVAQEAVKSGAYGIVKKPLAGADLQLAVAQAAERRLLKERARVLESSLTVKSEFEELVGQSPKMREVHQLVQTVSHSSATVFIRGEAGTGKELCARAIHAQGPRRARPFISVNCSALSETQLETELFGHVRGAVPGTTGTKKGIFESADGGTVFLDDLGELSASTQVRLLRLLGEGELRRIGSSDSIKVDVRVIAASAADLGKLKEQGKLREDLHGRLTLLTVDLPALRERRDDIPLLAQHFVKLFAQKSGKAIVGLTAAAQDALLQGRFGGNVRELRNTIERAVVLCQTATIDVADLPTGGATREVEVQAPAEEGESLSHLPYAEAKRLALRSFERRYLSSLLETNSFNISSAARAAGVDRSNFRRLLKQYEVARNGPISLHDDAEETAAPVRAAPVQLRAV